jgi:catechol 2,3-dioxygenase-like lactoylglutathione lyase family enzyme
MTPRALWIPFEVEDLDEATRFYTDRLGLSVVDSWERDGECGVVLRVADGAFIELVSPGAGHAERLLAFEHADESEVDSALAAWDGEAGQPYRHPRGHYGFTAPGPAGVKVMVWSER